MGAAASVANADNAPMACTLKGLPETIETAVYVREKWPIVSDRESDRDVVFLILAFLCLNRSSIHPAKRGDSCATSAGRTS